MSLVRGAKMLDVTFCGFGRKIFAVADWARVVFNFVEEISGVIFVSSTFRANGCSEKIEDVTDRGTDRIGTISQLFTLIVLIGLIVIRLTASFVSEATDLITLFLSPAVALTSTFFCFKSLMPRTMLSLFVTLMFVNRVSLFAASPTALVSMILDNSCCASS